MGGGVTGVANKRCGPLRATWQSLPVPNDGNKLQVRRCGWRPPPPPQKNKKLYWQSLSLILSNGYHQFLTILNIFITPLGIMQKLMHILQTWRLSHTKHVSTIRPHDILNHCIIAPYWVPFLKTFRRVQIEGRVGWESIFYSYKRENPFTKRYLEYTVGYARTNVIGSRTSFVRVSVRSSIDRNICI